MRRFYGALEQRDYAAAYGFLSAGEGSGSPLITRRALGGRSLAGEVHE